MSNTNSEKKSRKTQKQQYREDLHNPRTGEQKTIVANSEDALAKRIQEQCEKWDRENYVADRKYEAQQLSDNAHEIISNIGKLHCYPKRLTVKQFYESRIRFRRSPPDKKTIRKECHVPVLLRKIPEIFISAWRADRKEKESRAEELYQKRVSEYNEAWSDYQAEITSRISKFTVDNVEEVEKYFCYVILQSGIYTNGFFINYVPSLKVNYNPKENSLEVEFELPKVDLMPQEKDFEFSSKENHIKPTFLSETEQKSLYTRFVYEVALMIISSVYLSDLETGFINLVTFKGMKGLLDKSYGVERQCPIIEVQMLRKQFNELNLRFVDARSVWERIGGHFARDFTDEIYHGQNPELFNKVI